MVDEGQSSIAIPSNLKLSIRCLEAVRKRESIGGVGIENTKHPSNGFVKLSDEGLLRVPVLNVPWEDSNFGKYENPPTKFVIHSGGIEIGLFCR